MKVFFIENPHPASNVFCVVGTQYKKLLPTHLYVGIAKRRHKQKFASVYYNLNKLKILKEARDATNKSPLNS